MVHLSQRWLVVCLVYPSWHFDLLCLYWITYTLQRPLTVRVK